MSFNSVSTEELFAGLSNALRTDNLDEAGRAREQLLEGVGSARRHFLADVAVLDDPRAAFVRKMHRVDWRLGESGSGESMPSLCISILQHLSRNYEPELNIENMYYSSSSWSLLPETLGDRREDFLRDLLPLLCVPPAPPPSSETRAQLILLMRDYLATEFVGPLQIIDEAQRSDWLNMTDECLLAEMRTFTDSGGLFFYLDSDNHVYCPLLPRETFYGGRFLSGYATELLEELNEYGLLTSLFENWLSRLRGENDDGVRIYRSLQELVESVCQRETVRELVGLVTDLELDAGDQGSSSAYPLFYLDQVSPRLSLAERNRVKHELKDQICTALFTIIQSYCLEIQDKAARREREEQERLEQLAANVERSKQRFAQEKRRLEACSRIDLSYEAIRDNPECESLRRLYQEQSWNLFKERLVTGRPSVGLGTLNPRSYKPKDLQLFCRKLLKMFGLNENEFPGLFDRLEAETAETVGAECLDELCRILEQSSHVETTFSEDGDGSGGVLTSKGQQLRLSAALPQIRHFLESGYKVQEIHIVGATSLLIDADLDNELVHGKNVILVSNSVRVGRAAQIDTSGMNGAPPPPKPETPSGAGIRGTPGQRGKDGESAGNVYIESSLPVEDLPLLSIKCVGGNGGGGQAGGDGSDGLRGEDGLSGKISEKHPSVLDSYKEFKRGEPGKFGGSGGSAGIPGLGGSGGSGGEITVISGPETFEKKLGNEPTTQVDLLPNFKCGNGACGKTGVAGVPGKGGEGGAHGKDRAWTTSSVFWFVPWEDTEGYLELEKESGWIHRGYTVKEADSKPHSAECGARGDREEADKRADQVTQSVVTPKGPVQAERARASWEGVTTTLRIPGSVASEMQGQIETAKSSLQAAQAAQQLARSRRLEAERNAAQTRLNEGTERASRAQADLLDSHETVRKIKSLEDEVRTRLNAEVSQSVEAQLQQNMGVVVQVPACPNQLELSEYIQQLYEEVNNAGMNQEQVNEEREWASKSQQVVCTSSRPELEASLGSLAQLVSSIGVPALSRSVDACVQQLHLHFAGSIPLQVVSLMSKLVRRTQTQSSTSATAVSVETLVQIFTHKFSPYCISLRKPANKSDLDWAPLLPQTNASFQLVSNGDSLNLIFEQLYVTRLSSADTLHFEKELLARFPRFTEDIQGILLDILEVQLLGSALDTMNKEEGFMGAVIRRVRTAKNAAMNRGGSGGGGGSGSNAAKLTREEQTEFLSMFKRNLLPVLRALCSAFPATVKLSSCFEQALKHMDAPNLLSLILEKLTSVGFKDILNSKPEPATWPGLYAFLLPHYVQDDEKKLAEVEVMWKKNKLGAPDHETLTTIYNNNFRVPIVTQLQSALGGNTKHREHLDEFVELVESDEAALDFTMRIVYYSELLRAAQELKNDNIGNLPLHVLQTSRSLESAYGEICGQVLARVEGGRLSSYGPLSANELWTRLPQTVLNLKNQVRARTRSAAGGGWTKRTVSKLRGIGYLIKFLANQVVVGIGGIDELRALELALEKVSSLSADDADEALRSVTSWLGRLLDELWNRSVSELIIASLQRAHDGERLRQLKDACISRIKSLIQTFTVSNDGLTTATTMIVDPESVVSLLVFKVEWLAHLCLKYGQTRTMVEVASELDGQCMYITARDLIRAIVKIVDGRAAQIVRRSKLETLNSPTCSTLLSSPRVIKNYVDLLCAFRQEQKQESAVPVVGSRLSLAELTHELSLLILDNFGSSALCQFDGLGQTPLVMGTLEENKGALGDLVHVCGLKFGRENEPKKVSRDVGRFCDVARNVFHGQADSLIEYLRTDFEMKRAKTETCLHRLESWTSHRLAELRECRRVCGAEAGRAISELRCKYVQHLRGILGPDESTRGHFVEEWTDLERGAWRTLAHTQLSVPVDEETWLYSVFEKEADDCGLHEFIRYTMDALRRLSGRLDQEPAKRTCVTAEALRAGFVQLLEPFNGLLVLRTTWAQVHRLLLKSFSAAQEESETEEHIWAVVYGQNELYEDKEETDSFGAAALAVCRLYFRPDLSSHDRQLILRIQSSGLLAGQRVAEEFMKVIHNTTSSIGEALLDFGLGTKTRATRMLSPAEEEYLSLSEARLKEGKELEFPLQDLREDSAADWLRNVCVPHYVSAVLSNLDLISHPVVNDNVSRALVQWQSATTITTTSDAEPGRLQLKQWTLLLDEIVQGCSTSPICYAQLCTIFRNAARTAPASGLQGVADVLRGHTSQNWSRALYFLLLKELIAQLYPTAHSEPVVELRRSLVQLEDSLHKLATSTQTLLFHDELLECFYSKLSDASVGESAVPELQSLNRLIHQLSAQAQIDGVTVEELDGLSLGLWEEGLRICTYRRKGIAERASLELCVGVEEKFCRTTEPFVDVVLQEDPRNLDEYLTKLRNGDWVLSADLLRKLEEYKYGAGGTGAFRETICSIVDKEMDMLGQELESGRLAEAFFELGMNVDVTSAGNLSLASFIEELALIRSPTRPSSIYEATSTSIDGWGVKEIGGWVSAMGKLRGKEANLIQVHKIECLAVIAVGVRQVLGFAPRDAQILAVLRFFDSWTMRGSNGRFGEIATAEGKTLITGMLALLLSLGGYNGNIISSTPRLAQDGHRKMEPLFKLFKVQVSNICDEVCKRGSGNADQELGERYGAQIIYSDIGSLQTDLLWNEHLGKTYAKNGRMTHFMIADEVDSLLLDKGSHVLYISHSIPDLRHLKPLLIRIWTQFASNSVGGSEEEKRRLVVQLQDEVNRQLIPHPAHLRDFILERLPIWANHAHEALRMEVNDQYIVSDKVTVVDLPTGVEQASTQYSYGLHQFLQLKYGKKMTPESLKAIFISNMGYFNLQRSRVDNFKLFGLTGTLGCDQSKGLLRDLYNVDFMKLPRHKVKRCVKLPTAHIAENEEEWLRAIGDSVEAKMDAQPLLIICANVRDAQAVEAHLKQQPFISAHCARFFTYTSSTQDAGFQEMFNSRQPCREGDIIISTNLAGRGTDLAIEERCGEQFGLHVILATIPPNARVEKQAFGRTSRNGQRGSTEYIIRRVLGLGTASIQEYRRGVREFETARIKEIRAVQVKQILLEEELLRRFTTNYQTLMTDKQLWSPSTADAVKKVYGGLVKNRWAFWLDAMQPRIRGASNDVLAAGVREEFNFFWRSTRVAAGEKWGLCQGGADYVKLGRAQEADGKTADAVTTLLKGTQVEPYHNEILHYYLGICLLRLDEQKKNGATRWLGRHHLKIAREGIQRNCQSLHALSAVVASQESGAQTETLLSSQFKNELDLYEQHLHVLNRLLGTNIDAAFLSNIPGIDRDTGEAAHVLDSLLRVDSLSDRPMRIFKPLRLSRKVWSTDGGTLMFGHGRRRRRLVWPDMLKECAPGLETTVHEILQRSNGPRGVQTSTCPQPSVNVPDAYRRNDPEDMNNYIQTKVFTRPPNRRWIESGDFHDLLLTKEELWREVEGAGFIEEGSATETETWTVHFDENRFRELEDIRPSNKMLIGRYLHHHNGQTYNRAVFRADLQTKITENWKSVEEVLKREGLLRSEVDFKGSVEQDVYERLRIQFRDGKYAVAGLPVGLEPLSLMLESMLIGRETASGGLVLLQEITTEALTYLIPYSNEGRATIIDCLTREGILKPPSVDWALSHHFGKEQKRKREIKDCFRARTLSDELIEETRKRRFGSGIADAMETIGSVFGLDEDTMCVRLRGVFKVRHKAEGDAEFKNYLKAIRKALVRSVGRVKVTDKLQVCGEYEPLAGLYTQTGAGGQSVQFPSDNIEELAEFYLADFERMPNIGRKQTWVLGATCVVFFGVVQIGASIYVGAKGVLLPGGLNAAGILMSEGITDFVFALSCARAGRFSIKQYCIHKGVSITLSIGTQGLATYLGTTLLPTIGMEASEELLKLGIRHVLWGAAQMAAPVVAMHVTGMLIELIHDHLRVYLVDKFRVLFKRALLGSRFQAAMTRLRTAAHKLHETSYFLKQAEQKLLDEFQSLGGKLSPYVHALHTVIRNLGRIVLNHAFKHIASRCNALGGWTVGAVKFALKLVDVSTLLTHGRLNFVFAFAEFQLGTLTTNIEQASRQLKGRAATSFAPVQRTNQDDFEQFLNAFVVGLENKLVEDGAVRLQQELLEPELKALANKVLLKAFDVSYGYLRSRSNKNAAPPAVESDEQTAASKEELRARGNEQREEMKEARNAVRKNVPKGVELDSEIVGTKMTVQMAVEEFGEHVLFNRAVTEERSGLGWSIRSESTRGIRMGPAFAGTESGRALIGAQAFFSASSSSSHLRSLAVDRGLPVIRPPRLI